MRGAVGRDEEVAAVRRALAARQSVAIVGAAGIGKSTILRAALDGVPARVGASLPSLRWHTYLPLKMALGHELAGGPDEVAALVADALTDDVLAVEDLQWADDGTSAVLASLAGVVPVAVTSRSPLEPSCAGSAWDVVEHVGPLRRRDAAALVRRLHPDLEGEGRSALLTAAGGNPLLLETLAGPQTSSATLERAVGARLEQLEVPARAVLERLSVLGRPAFPAEVGLEEPGTLGGLVVDDGTRIAIRHALLSDAVLSSLGSRREAVHRDVAARLPTAEAARHHLAGGEAALAREGALAAVAGTTDAGRRAELLSIVVEADVALGRPCARTLVDASAALVAASRWSEAAELAGQVSGDPALEAEAALHQARAFWFGGQVEQARTAFHLGHERAAAAPPELSVRLAVEWAYLEVRGRDPGALELARTACDLAETHGVHVARARTVLGAALLYEQQDGWEAMLDESSGEAADAGDEELVCEATYNLVSGLGFGGRVREAMALSARGRRRADALGLSTWSTHFLAATLMHEAMICGDRMWVADEAASLHDRHPTFRNRAYSSFAAMLALTDLGRRAEADAVIARLSIAAPESHVFRLCAATELAWLDRDPIGLASIDEGRAVGEAYFGLRILAEVSVQHLAVELGRAVAVSLPATILPLFQPALQEIEGLQRWLAGDVDGSLASLDRAAARWMEVPIPRYSVRAAFAASLLAARARRPDAEERRQRALGVARRHGLASHVRRIAGAPADQLTIREREVLELVAGGRTSNEIASALGISGVTVEQHVGTAKRKLGAATRREAAGLLRGGDEAR